MHYEKLEPTDGHRPEQVDLEQVVTSEDLFRHIQGLEACITSEDMDRQRLGTYEYDASRMKAVMIRRRTNNAFEHFLSSPRDTGSCLEIATLATYGRTPAFIADEIPLTHIALARQASLDVKDGRRLIALSAPTWTPEERHEFGTTLATRVHRILERAKNNETLSTNTAKAYQTSWLNYFRRLLQRDIGGEDTSYVFYPHLRRDLTSPGHSLSPEGEVALAAHDAFTWERRDQTLKVVTSTANLPHEYFHEAKSMVEEIEAEVVENQAALIDLARTAPEARRLQTWSIDSFTRLMAFMAQKGSANAAGIMSRLPKGPAPLVAINSLAARLRTAMPEYADQPIDVSKGSDMTAAFETLFYAAHHLGQHDAEYAAETGRIDSIMNIIRVVSEVTSYSLEETEVALNNEHLAMVFPDMNPEDRQKWVSETTASYERPRVSTLFYIRRAEERSKRQYANHRLFVEGGLIG